MTATEIPILTTGRSVVSLRKNRKTWIVTEREKNDVHLTEWNVAVTLRVTREGRDRRNVTEKFQTGERMCKGSRESKGK